MTNNRRQFLLSKLSSVFELPPIFYYLGLGALCVLLFVFSWLGKKDTIEAQPATQAVASPVYRVFTETPDPVPEKQDVYTSLRRAIGAEDEVRDALNACIRKLEKTVSEHVSDGVAETPDWISSTFVGSGIDREKFQPRYSDQGIKVERWRKSDSAPEFSGHQAFQEFITETISSWQGALNFRHEIEAFGTGVETGMVVADLFSESYGQTNQATGIQATGIWKTQWSWKNDTLTLESIDIRACEQITATLPGGKLLRDCTASILKRCDSLPNQLAYGLDQWARKIPNLDIFGNQGLAIGDINQDGLDDIYMCQPHGLPNLLLIQNPDGTVDDNGESYRLDILDESHSALIIDLDNDRDQDLVVSTDEGLLLLSNTGQGQFQLEHQLAIGRNSFSISAADFDQDGDLDLFLCKFQEINRQNDLLMLPANISSANDGGRNVLLRNEEGWNFKDVTEQVGITQDNHFYSRSAIWADYDFDGDLDLYVTNEFAADQVFENQSGWFSDVSEQLGVNVAARHRSVSLGEFDGDGRLDFFVATDSPISGYQASQATDHSDVALAMRMQEMFLGESQIWSSAENNGPFRSFFLRAPIFSSQSAFSTATADLNNDGLDDAVVTNGLLTRYSSEDIDSLFYANVFSNPVQSNESMSDQIARIAHDTSELARFGYSFAGHQHNRCYLSIGEMGFANFSSLAGFDFPDDGRAIATTDWDCDGDTDIVMTCRGSPQLRILCNQLDSTNSYLQFDLVGTESNCDAIGARVEVYVDNNSAPRVKTVQAGSGNLSQSTKRLLFGLGSCKSIKKAVVVWPTGKSQTFSNVNPNTRYRVVEGKEKLQEKTNQRFELAIQPGQPRAPDSQPNMHRRAWFYPRQPLPPIQYQSESGKWERMEPIKETPMLAIFCSPSTASQRILQHQWQSLSGEEVDCVAVFLEPDSGDPTKNWNAAESIISSCGFPHRWGTASASTKDKLRYMFGQWFSHQDLERCPFALLIDGNNNVCGYYRESEISLDQIAADVERIDKPEWKYRTATAPLGGRWMARYRKANLNRIRTRLKEVGYLEDAAFLAEKSKPQRALELCQKGIELDATGDTSRARLFFQQAISMDPDCIPAYIAEGNVFRQIANAQTSDKVDVRLQIQQAAADNFNRAIELDPTNTEAIIGRANIAIDQNRIDEALHQLSAYLVVDPTRYEIHAIIGRLLFHQNKHKQAAEYLIEAFENRPTLPYVAADLGFLYLRSGRYEQARKFLRLANRLQPSEKNSLRLLAEAEFVLGEFDAATSLFERVAELDPNRRRTKNLLAWLLATNPYEESRDAEQALAIISPLVNLFGDKSPSTLEIYAACFAEQGRFEEALDYQNRALDLVNNGGSTDRYTEEQRKGLLRRLELYKRKRPYRTADITQIPIRPAGLQR